jgi:hypothetical protein
MDLHFFMSSLKLILIILLFCPAFIFAQENRDEILSGIFDDQSAPGDDQSMYEEIADDLEYYSGNPLDLNRADADDLAALHILSEFQVLSFLEYRRKNGPLYSINELLVIPGFSESDVARLTPFVSVTGTVTSIKEHSAVQQKIILKFVRDLNRKEGFRAGTDIPFSGKNRYLLSKYQLSTGKKIAAGFTLEQDAGESFRSGSHFRGPDFASGYILYDPGGLFNKIIIGDFRAGYGQGLILGGYPQKKGSEIIIKPAVTGIRKYSGSGENEFFRGAAVSLGRDHFRTDIFFSGMKRDASVHVDSCRYFESLTSTGYHRTVSEMEKKDALRQISCGINSSFRSRAFTAGFLFMGENYDADNVFSPDRFNEYRYPASGLILNAGTDYRINLPHAVLFGEAAISKNKKPAFTSGLIAELHPLLHYSLIFRKYDPGYTALRSAGFGEKSTTRNEEGIYTGFSFYPFSSLKLDVFADHYRFPFSDFSSAVPKNGSEYLLNCSLSKKSSCTISARFRLEKNQKLVQENETGIGILTSSTKSDLRFDLKYMLSSCFDFRSRLEINKYSEGRASSSGFYCNNDLGFRSQNSKYRLWFRHALFDIPGWDNRIYAYENDLVYSFSVPAFNSSGSRIIVLVKVAPFKNMELSARFSSTFWSAKKTTGSGPDEVISNTDKEIKFLIVYKI